MHLIPVNVWNALIPSTRKQQKSLFNLGLSGNAREAKTVMGATPFPLSWYPQFLLWHHLLCKIFLRLACKRMSVWSTTSNGTNLSASSSESRFLWNTLGSILYQGVEEACIREHGYQCSSFEFLVKQLSGLLKHFLCCLTLKYHDRSASAHFIRAQAQNMKDALSWECRALVHIGTRQSHAVRGWFPSHLFSPGSRSPLLWIYTLFTLIDRSICSECCLGNGSSNSEYFLIPAVD